MTVETVKPINVQLLVSSFTPVFRYGLMASLRVLGRVRMASTLLGRVGVNCTPVGRVVAVSLLRHCSVLGSPACGGEGREEGVFREVLREFPGNR